MAPTLPNRPTGHGLHADAAGREYHPAAQSLQFAAPGAEYRPAAHGTAVAFIDPAPQAYPAAHCPLQLAVASPVTSPYVPGGHGLQDPDAPRAYCPAMHVTPYMVVEPGAHAAPAMHGPLQLRVDCPLTPP